MSRFDHPNIAKYWEFYEDDKNIYLVMEYVDDIGNIG
jgi:serine/threonine protein kinase